ncbi:hypothetical protein [Stenotrophomonas sp. VV52]|uniref:hypothetical protein n=1 Tax=Stenotrophomonas sp. VV52 TaxID=2066958 RepID=UPI0015596E9A|nr:hypothetical protein [Stenotrophomonas sp. VV52]
MAFIVAWERITSALPFRMVWMFLPARNPLPRKKTMTANSGQRVRKADPVSRVARRAWDEGMGKRVVGRSRAG